MSVDCIPEVRNQYINTAQLELIFVFFILRVSNAIKTNRNWCFLSNHSSQQQIQTSGMRQLC